MSFAVIFAAPSIPSQSTEPNRRKRSNVCNTMEVYCICLRIKTAFCSKLMSHSFRKAAVFFPPQLTTIHTVSGSEWGRRWREIQRFWIPASNQVRFRPICHSNWCRVKLISKVNLKVGFWNWLELTLCLGFEVPPFLKQITQSFPQFSIYTQWESHHCRFS